MPTWRRYLFDPDRSLLSIEARSTLHPIRSDATGLEGWIEMAIDGSGRLDLARPPSAHIEFALERLRSGNPLLDREAERRLQVRTFPLVTADLVSLEPCPGQHAYLARGAIGFHGRVGELEGRVTLSVSGNEIEVSGETTVDIRQFGVRPPRLLALRVHPEVLVFLHAWVRPAVTSL